MPRGRQYYDPIIQVPGKVEGAPTRRIELYPEGSVSDGTEGQLRWVGRLIGDQGEVIAKAAGSFDHDDALRQAQELWPGLEVYELREEGEDSTWDGMGPSPRLWQGSHTEHDQPGAHDRNLVEHVPPAVETITGIPGDAPSAPSTEIHAVNVPLPGVYVRLDGILQVLEEYAQQYAFMNNPSAALGIREAANALREAF